uniref:NAD-dependent deacetylase sirtuin-2 n=1 Tax=Caligus rogercresseyi TaxID=217165 RepID=C1BMY9_CALRO|nr:NAD-dependent deacetylase sirtuin-2 [Caligus rogercresseyi]
MGQGSSSHSARQGGRSISLESLSSGIKDGTYKNIVILSGAGISTNAGIPDFRSPSLGLYFKLKKYNLPYPEAVFEGSYFRKDPLPFYSLVREIYPSRLEPTLTHKFLSLLSKKKLLRRVFTQNIDGLEGLAGIPSEEIVEAHGSFARSYCTSCKREYELTWLKREIFAAQESNGGVPKCESCSGIVRPDVVLFGESMPPRFSQLAESELKKADLLLVIGTSLAVAPFNGLVGLTQSGTPRVYISKTRPGQSNSLLGKVLGLNSSIRFEEDTDLVLLDDCDAVVLQICRQLGWEKELRDVQVEVME